MDEFLIVCRPFSPPGKRESKRLGDGTKKLIRAIKKQPRFALMFQTGVIF